MAPPNVLLSGVVGSTAYGLAREGSDVDRLGVYAAPTVAFHGLRPPTGKNASVVTTGPDATFHEAGKATALLLSCNPTITEILWLENYEVKTELGEEAISIRGVFLSERAVRNAYLGYATQQFKRLQDRGDGSFSADTRKRSAKHARHLWRLVGQGIALHKTGALTVRLTAEEAEECWAFGEHATSDLDVARKILAAGEHAFSRPGVLPARPDEGAAEAWLLRVRAAYLGGADTRACQT